MRAGGDSDGWRSGRGELERGHMGSIVVVVDVAVIVVVVVVVVIVVIIVVVNVVVVVCHPYPYSHPYRGGSYCCCGSRRRIALLRPRCIVTLSPRGREVTLDFLPFDVGSR